MPIYEFLCQDCNRVFNFFARASAAADRRPSCPKCGRRRMKKLFSRFAAASKSSTRSTAREGPAPGGDGEDDLSPAEEARMEKAMMSLAGDMDKIDENDPRQLASVMRRLAQATGEPMDPETNEMIGRLEAGEDPDKVEEKMADAFGDEHAAGVAGGGTSYDGGLYDL